MITRKRSKHRTHQVLSSLLTHEAAKRDDGRNASEIEEDYWRNALRIEAIKDVAFIQSVATLHVRNHAAKQPVSSTLRNQPVR